MNRGNEIDPMLMQNAHILNTRRTPTASERKQMEREAVTMALMQVAGTALGSILESGEEPLRNSDELAKLSLQIAKDLLNKSEESKEDFGEQVGKRKLRNQLAAQILYSSLRGGQPYKLNLIHRSFTIATSVIEGAEAHAEEMVEDDDNSSDIIVT